MIGLINRRAVGAGMVKAAETAQPFILQTHMAEILKSRDGRLTELQGLREKNLLNLQADARKSAGMELAAEQSSILKPREDQFARNLEEAGGNAAARDFVMNEGGITDRERAQAGYRAASKLGLIEYQREFGDEIRDIDSNARQAERNAEESRHHKALESAVRKDDGKVSFQSLGDGRIAKIDKQGNITGFLTDPDTGKPVMGKKDMSERELQLARAYMDYAKAEELAGNSDEAKVYRNQAMTLLKGDSSGVSKLSSERAVDLGKFDFGANRNATPTQQPVVVNDDSSLYQASVYAKAKLASEARQLRERINSGKLSEQELFTAKMRLGTIEEQLHM